MGVYKYIKEIYEKKSKDFIIFERQRLISWRKENAISKIERPTNLARAREVGYKAKNGFVVVRVRVPRGGKRRPTIRHGRSSKHFGTRLVMGKSYQRIAEERANKHFFNLEVLNSYYIAEDGKHYWYEVILVDPCAPEIIADKDINWICTETGRVYRGKTSAGRKGRGLRYKGTGSEKHRPSLNAHKNLGK